MRFSRHYINNTYHDSKSTRKQRDKKFLRFYKSGNKEKYS